MFSGLCKCMDEYEIGDLVVTYILNSSMAEPEVLQYGIIVDTNLCVDDILVLDNDGYSRWWHCRRWKILRKNKKIK